MNSYWSRSGCNHSQGKSSGDIARPPRSYKLGRTNPHLQCHAPGLELHRLAPGSPKSTGRTCSRCCEMASMNQNFLVPLGFCHRVLGFKLCLQYSTDTGSSTVVPINPYDQGHRNKLLSLVCFLAFNRYFGVRESSAGRLHHPIYEPRNEQPDSSNHTCK